MYTKGTRSRGRLRTLGLLAVIGSLVAGCGGNGDDSGGGSSEDPVQVAFFGPLANTYVEAHPLVAEELAWFEEYSAGFAGEEPAGQAETEAGH